MPHNRMPDWHGDETNPCREDPELWFPKTAPLKTVKNACLTRCRNTAACLAFALDNHIEHGIYGGLTFVERKRLARENGTTRPAHRPRKAAA